MINLTTQMKSSLITKQNCIQVIIFVFHFVKHLTTNLMSLSLSPSLKACTNCKLYGWQRNRFFRIFHIVVLGMFKSRLSRFVDFRGLRTTKVCGTSFIVSSATQDRPWPGPLRDTQPFSRNQLYRAKIFFLWGDFYDTFFLYGSGRLQFAKPQTTLRAPYRYTTP
jgi:hypothetical protein